MPEPGVVIATRRRDGIPASMKFSIGRSIIITPILVFVGFYFAPAPYRPGSVRMADFPPNSFVYLDCEQRGPTSRARLAYAGASADAIRGVHRLSHKAYCPGLTPIARSCHRGRWGTVAIRNGLLMMRKAHEKQNSCSKPGSRVVALFQL
jgi:hypothetical protein